MTITHICMSDLHFGAETSLLTDLSDNYQPRYREASPVLLRLMDCLRTLIKRQADAARPTLVLAGDVLELALSETHEAAMTFEKFLTLAFPGGDDDLFAREIVYVPGNHDHHLWERTREIQYMDYLTSVPPGAPLGREWHITRLFARDVGARYPEQQLLTALARRHPQLADLSVVAAYPNMGIRSRDGSRAVVFTHGHYIEPLYTLISDLKGLIFPERPIPDTLVELETENFAWIDFFWSTMGRSGDAGKQVQQIYEMLATKSGQKELGKRLAAGIVSRYFSDNLVPDAVERFAVEKVIAAMAARAMATERGDVDQPLGADATQGLARYVSGPLARQLKHECKSLGMPQHVALVFGHTHKPFERSSNIANYDNVVDIYNTGGWVVDSVERTPLHGAAIVLVDHDGHSAALRMYNEVPKGESPTGVRVASARPNPLATDLEQAVEATPSVWAAFADAARAAVSLRAEALASRAG